MVRWLRRQEPILAAYCFLLALAVGVCIESYRLGLGSPHSPGPGFAYFWTSTLLGILSARLLVKSLLQTRTAIDVELWNRQNLGRVAWTVVALLIYAFALERVGYLLVTFAFLTFLFGMLWEAPRRWAPILALAVLTAIVSFVVFDRWFALQLPKGLFRWP